MTTHYQKIQALGERMASNLETMGVSASFSDGGLTLADKILQIQRFNDGLTLYADKSIAQSSDTVNLYALLLNNGKPVSGETVTFTCDAPLVTAQITSAAVELYDDYFVTSTKTGSSWDYVGTGASGFVQFNSTKLNTYTSGYGTEVTHNGYIHIKNGVLTYKDTNGDAHTIDVSSIDTTKSYGSVSFTIKYYWLEGTTGSNGVASAQYTCTGAGLKTITAESGSVVSNTYPVWDTLFYDDGVTSPKTATWSNYQDRITVSVDSTNGTTLLRDSATGTGYYFADNSTTTGFFDFTTPLIIEFEMGAISDKSNSGIDFATSNLDNNKTFNQLGIAENDSIKIIYDGSVIKVYRNGSTTSNDVNLSITGSFGIGFFILPNRSVTFKNFKIYQG